MNFRQAIASGFAHYMDFFGRATAAEFWFWILFCALGAVVTEMIDGALFIPHPGQSPLNSIFMSIIVLPTLSVMVRRLHDIGRSGWWLLLAPTGVGIFVLLRWASLEGISSETEYDRLTAQTVE